MVVRTCQPGPAHQRWPAAGHALSHGWGLNSLDLLPGRLINLIFNKRGLGAGAAGLPSGFRPPGELLLLRGRRGLVLHAASAAGLPGELRLRRPGGDIIQLRLGGVLDEQRLFADVLL